MESRKYFLRNSQDLKSTKKGMTQSQSGLALQAQPDVHVPQFNRLLHEICAPSCPAARTPTHRAHLDRRRADLGGSENWISCAQMTSLVTIDSVRICSKELAGSQHSMCTTKIEMGLHHLTTFFFDLLMEL